MLLPPTYSPAHENHLLQSFLPYMAEKDNTLSHGLIEDGEWYHWRSSGNTKTNETGAGEMGEDHFLFLLRTWVIFPASLSDGSQPLVILALLDLMHPSGL